MPLFPNPLPSAISLQASAGGTPPDVWSDGTNTYVEASSSGIVKIRPHGASDTNALQVGDGTLGIFGHAPSARPAAYSGAWSGTSRSLPNDSGGSIATTAATNVTPFGYTTSAQANAIVSNVNALWVDIDAIKSVLKQMLTDLQGFGLLQ